MENETIEIWGSCGSEIGPSVGFGIEMPLKDYSTDDVSWIFEGMSDSISENWQEFEDAAEQTKAECLEYYFFLEVHFRVLIEGFPFCKLLQ